MSLGYGGFHTLGPIRGALTLPTLLLDVVLVGLGIIIRIRGDWIALKCFLNFRTNTFGNFNPEECESDY